MTESEPTSTDQTASNEASLTRRVRDRVPWIRLANAVGVLLLLAVVLPFAIYAFPQLAGASQGYVVLSGSMEPAMGPGDAIIVESVDTSEIEEGDVITFARESEPRPTTHRVQAIVRENEGTLFVTKGDANEEVDQEQVTPDRVEGRIMTLGGHLFVIPYLGFFLEFVQTQTGFVLLFVLPIVLFLGNEVHNLVTGTGESADDAVDDSGHADSEVLEAFTATARHGGDTTDASADAAVDDTESADAAISLQPTEFRLGLLVLAAFAVYGSWVAYAFTAPWSVGVAAAIVMATVLFGALYVFGEPESATEAADAAVDRWRVTVQSGVPADETLERPRQSVPTPGTLLEIAVATGGVLYEHPEEPVHYVPGRDVRYVYRADSDSDSAFQTLVADDHVAFSEFDAPMHDAETTADSSTTSEGSAPSADGPSSEAQVTHTPAWVDAAFEHPAQTATTHSGIDGPRRDDHDDDYDASDDMMGALGDPETGSADDSKQWPARGNPGDGGSRGETDD